MFATVTGIEPGRSAVMRLEAPPAWMAERGARVLIVDQEELTLWGFAVVLNRQSWVDRCVAVPHPSTARSRLDDGPFDVVLIDARFGVRALLALVADVRATSPQARALVLSSGQPPTGAALPAVDRMWSTGRLVAGVRAALAEGAVPHEAPAATTLSPREYEVLELIACGATNDQVAAQLTVSPNTVKRHLSSLYRKLQTHNRAGTATRARELGLLR